MKIPAIARLAPAPASSHPGAFPSPGRRLAAWPEYLVDSFQRNVLFLDLMRQRANQQIAIAAQPTATVLQFEQKILMSGKDLKRPINYSLSEILALPGMATDPNKRPVVVIDPRAGQGPGIGGSKEQSEIGDALAAGHPVYFIGFSATPEPGQQFLDVVEGQVAFFERVVALHPEAPRPFAIGNCQAGYQTLMVAILRPDLFGPCLVPGSPMSYWQGVRGKYPMRYTGGMLGGSWLTALTSDLGNGKIDGAELIMNFDYLNPAYALWGKQYEVYVNIDAGALRYLNFEKWWGDFIELTGDELQYLIDNLFIGDKLSRNELHASDGTIFDLRNVTAPVLVFTSSEDNISPPPQSLGWILDLYDDEDDIRANDRTIIYCLSHNIGHLAIFVSSSVGGKQDREFLELMDVIDCLPPGLHEMVILPRPAGMAPGGFATGDWFARFERRSLEDIRALGRNSPDDDRAFATAARLSGLNLALYRTWLQPMVRALASQPTADLTRALNPLRLSYTLFADSNPFMQGVRPLAAQIAAVRQSAAVDNPYLNLQTWVSDQIGATLADWSAVRDRCVEQIFFGFYGSPVVQVTLGISGATDVRPRPSRTPDRIAARLRLRDTAMETRSAGGFNAALTRAVLYVSAADQAFDQGSAYALDVVRQRLMQLSLSDFKRLVREQFLILELDGAAAIQALAQMVPAERHGELLAQLHTIANAAAATSVAEQTRLVELAQALAPLNRPAPALALVDHAPSHRWPARPAVLPGQAK